MYRERERGKRSIEVYVHHMEPNFQASFNPLEKNMCTSTFLDGWIDIVNLKIHQKLYSLVGVCMAALHLDKGNISESARR